MKVTSRTHIEARLQSTLFTVLLLVVVGLLAWLSTHYEIKADWTVNNRHSLSEASTKLLDELSGPIVITAYAEKDNMNAREIIKDVLERYQRHKSDISLRFVDPFTVPNEVQTRGIQVQNEILIDYQDRTEHVRQFPPTEQLVTSALQRLARSDNRLILFLEGHGERSPEKFEDQGFSNWTNQLQKSGFQVHTLNFGKMSHIPQQTDVIVIASPQKQLLPREVTLLTDYINQGGHLLWFIDPNSSLQGLEPLAKQFGLQKHPGIIVDPVSQLLGNNPTIVSITTTGYGDHPITSGLQDYLTLFPHTSGLLIEPSFEEDWEVEALLTTNPQAWSETGELEGSVEYSEETDITGPLDIAFALSRTPLPLDSEAEAEEEIAQELSSETDSKESADTQASANEVETTDSKVEIQEANNNASENTTETDSKLDSQNQTNIETADDTKAEKAENTQKTEADKLNLDMLDDTELEQVIAQQRVIIVGESDFLSNAFIGFGGNMDLGMKMMNWLTEDDAFIDIPTNTAVDLGLELSETAVIWLGAFFLFILPLGLISTGISIWLHRRKN
jgi:ABC-type uncharacterized transport system involved in gliding motility auxiliary subunit